MSRAPPIFFDDRTLSVAQDSSEPQFWESRYREQVIPWDAGKVPAALQDYASSLPAKSRILVPGCGSAYEAAFLHERGFDVLAVDFSPAAVDAARKNLGAFGHIVRLADFFTLDAAGRFDVIYERAFLCALPRKMWTQYAAQCADLLNPNGVIAGFFFFADTPRGPPFGTTQSELDALMAERFERMDDCPVADSIAIFEGKERWQVWQRLR